MKLSLTDLGKYKPKPFLEIWNGQIYSKSIKFEIGITLEQIDELEKQVRDFKKQIEMSYPKLFFEKLDGDVRSERIRDLLTVLTKNLTILKLERGKQSHVFETILKLLHGLFEGKRFSNSMTEEQIDELLSSIIKSK